MALWSVGPYPLSNPLAPRDAASRSEAQQDPLQAAWFLLSKQADLARRNAGAKRRKFVN